jgi:hypothetical protein
LFRADGQLGSFSDKDRKEKERIKVGSFRRF